MKSRIALYQQIFAPALTQRFRDNFEDAQIINFNESRPKDLTPTTWATTITLSVPWAYAAGLQILRPLRGLRKDAGHIVQTSNNRLQKVS